MNARTEQALGLVYDLPINEYHASAGISNSGLNDFAQSPFHYHALHRNPLRPPAEDKPGQLEGNLAHCTILEPHAFARRYSIGPAVSKNTKIWHAFEESVPTGVKAIKPDQAETAHAQAASVRSLPEVASLLEVGRAEVSAYWIDPVTGLLCRCRPDFVHDVNESAVILLDVKTCSDASPEEFARQVARKAYHRQNAFYTDGYELASGKEVVGFVFVAVEDKWPFAASAVMLDDQGVESGRTQIAELLPRFAHCHTTDTWPGYSESIELITLPRWAS